MDDQEYSERAARTLSGDFHTEKFHPGTMIRVLQRNIQIANQLDMLKKALFYGREIGDSCPDYMSHTLGNFTRAEQNIAHGIIGLITEAAELGEVLLNRMQTGQPMDTVHIVEEAGDVFWYLSTLLSGTPFDMAQAKARNIDKLMKRYPDKFTLNAAENRDLAAERAALEGSGEV